MRVSNLEFQYGIDEENGKLPQSNTQIPYNLNLERLCGFVEGYLNGLSDYHSDRDPKELFKEIIYDLNEYLRKNFNGVSIANDPSEWIVTE